MAVYKFTRDSKGKVIKTTKVRNASTSSSSSSRRSSSSSSSKKRSSSSKSSSSKNSKDIVKITYRNNKPYRAYTRDGRSFRADENTKLTSVSRSSSKSSNTSTSKPKQITAQDLVNSNKNARDLFNMGLKGNEVTAILAARESKDLSKIKNLDTSKFFNKLQQKGVSADTQSQVNAYKLAVNQELARSGKKNIDFSKSVDTFQKEYEDLQKKRKKTRDNLNKNIKKSTSNSIQTQLQGIENKVLTGQSVSPDEMKKYTQIVKTKNKELTQKQLNLGKKILMAPTNYGKNLVIRYEKGETNPFLKDVKAVATGLGKEMGDMLNFVVGVKGITINSKGESYDGLIAAPARKAINYGQKLAKEAGNGRAAHKVIAQDLVKAGGSVKSFGRKSLDVAKFVKDNPTETALLVGVAIEAGVISSKAAFMKDPKENTGRAVAWLFPGTIIKATAKTGQLSVKAINEAAKGLVKAEKALKAANPKVSLAIRLKNAETALTNYKNLKFGTKVLKGKQKELVLAKFDKFEKSKGFKVTPSNSKKALTSDLKQLGYSVKKTEAKVIDIIKASEPVKVKLTSSSIANHLNKYANNKKKLKESLKQARALGFAVSREKLKTPIIDLVNNQILNYKYVVKKKAIKKKPTTNRKAKKAAKKQATRKLTEKDLAKQLNPGKKPVKTIDLDQAFKELNAVTDVKVTKSGMSSRMGKKGQVMLNRNAVKEVVKKDIDTKVAKYKKSKKNHVGRKQSLRRGHTAARSKLKTTTAKKQNKVKELQETVKEIQKHKKEVTKLKVETANKLKKYNAIKNAEIAKLAKTQTPKLTSLLKALQKEETALTKGIKTANDQIKQLKKAQTPKKAQGLGNKLKTPTRTPTPAKTTKKGTTAKKVIAKKLSTPPKKPAKPKKMPGFDTRLTKGDVRLVDTFVKTGTKRVTKIGSKKPYKEAIDEVKNAITRGKHALARSFSFKQVGVKKGKDKGQGTLRGFRKKLSKDPYVQEWVQINALSSKAETKAIQKARKKAPKKTTKKVAKKTITKRSKK